MLIRSPSSFHYPVTVTELLVQQDDTVERFAPLFSYFYKTTVTEGNKYGERTEVLRTFPTKFQAETGGKLVSWKIRKGDVITGTGVPLVEIEEPCRHEVQFGGLCANCGQDMTEVDYATTHLNAERAQINMTHGHTALKISNDEAQRINETASRRLLASKRLSLVVDLDQTIIHATVDPTVAEWQKDPSNPNYDAVKDVKAFQLIDEGPGGRGCWYYIKLRPGLMRFLERISQSYELHIYTMGTRAYALNIAKIIDSDGKIFGDRILSRDESGSLTVKTLHRLFPVDTKMVVIIDDRGDVWNWSDNLVKVKAYDFFVGIGDINSAFLPKRNDLIPPTIEPANSNADSEPEVKENGETVAESKAVASLSSQSGDAVVEDGDISALEQRLVAMAGSTDPETISKQSSEQDEKIAHQVEDRPLQRMQQKLEEIEEEEARKEQEAEGNGEATPESQKHQHRHNLLQDNDEELYHLEESLTRVHNAFFETYEKSLAGSQGGRVAQLRGDRIKKAPTDDLLLVPDIKDIMPEMKQQVLRGVVIVFSGVIPLQTNYLYHDWTLWAKSFGARVMENLTKSTTHVVAPPGKRTSKVKQAARHSKIKIVTTDWLMACISQWQHVQEGPFTMDVQPEESEPRNPLDGSLPFHDLEDDVDLSNDEGEDDDQLSSVLPDEDAVELAAQGPGQSAGAAGTEVSPETWASVDDELEEFLNGTSDSEDGIGTDDESDASTKSSDSPKKRKRATDSVEGSETEESDTNVDNGSKLQKRKRRALERTTGLANVTSAKDSSGLPSPDTTGPDEEEKADAAGPVDEGDVNDDDLEAQLMAEFDNADEDEDQDLGGGG